MLFKPKGICDIMSICHLKLGHSTFSCSSIMRIV